MPTIALSTGSLHTYGIARVFELAADSGFEAVEVLVDHRWDSRDPAYLQRLSREIGLPVVAVHSPFVPHVPGWPSDPLARLRESAALARQLGASVVVTHPPLRIHLAKIELFGAQRRSFLLPLFLPISVDFRHFLLNGLARFEAAEKVLVGVENMPAKRFLGIEICIHALNDLEVLAALPHLTLDTTHLGTWGLDPLATYERLKTRIIHVHLSNFDGVEHRLPGDGHLPLGELLRRLTRDRFQGAVTIELNPEVLQAEDEAQVRVHLHRVIQFCRANMAG